MKTMDPRIDVAFELLEKATLLEKEGSNRIEAATKVGIKTTSISSLLEFFALTTCHFSFEVL